MDKKIVIAASAVVLIIALVITAIFLFKGDKQVENENNNVDTNQIAKDIQPYVPDKTVEEIDDILNKDTTKEQNDVIDDAIDKISLPENSKVNDEGQLVIENDNGEEGLAVHPHQDIIDMTDEEAEEEYDKLLDELNEMLKNNSNNQDDQNIPTITPDDNTSEITTTPNNQGTNENTGSTKPNTGTVWDQEFYDTLNDRQKELYASYDDYGREMMKGNMEIAREWEKEGYIGSDGHQSTGEEIEESWSHVGVTS